MCTCTVPNRTRHVSRLQPFSELQDEVIRTLSVAELRDRVQRFATQFGFTVALTVSIAREDRGAICEALGILSVTVPRYVADQFRQSGSTIAITQFINSALLAGSTNPHHKLPKYICTSAHA